MASNYVREPPTCQKLPQVLGCSTEQESHLVMLTFSWEVDTDTTHEWRWCWTVLSATWKEEVR